MALIDSTKITKLLLTYDRANARESALNLVYAVRPEWKETDGEIDIYQFDGGLMNSLFKISKIKPGKSTEEIERQALLLRVYGLNTEVVVDRNIEAEIHSELASLKLAAPLLARFQNGLIYEFVPGVICSPQNMTEPKTWRLIARTLGEWHGRLKLSVRSTNNSYSVSQAKKGQPLSACSKHLPISVWTEMQSWVSLLPEETEKQRARKTGVQLELDRSFDDLEQWTEMKDHQYVIGHNDLLSANVVLPVAGTHPKASIGADESDEVMFIDYEYAKPTPAAFDLANHFSEWGGFECDYNMLPTRDTRREFVKEYLASYGRWQGLDKTVQSQLLAPLLADIDRFRGMAGFRWALHAMIEESITEIDFDWTAYAELRMAEYWAWRNEESGQRSAEGKPMPLREQRWAQEI